MKRSQATPGRLAIVLGPRGTAAVARASGGRRRTDYARRLIQRLVRAPAGVRARLVENPAPALPRDRAHRSRLDVRMPAQLRADFDAWCGSRLRAPDALRAAVHLDAAGALFGAEPAPAAPGELSELLASPVPAARARSAEPQRSQRRPPRRAPKRRVARPKPPAAPRRRSAHELALERVVERVRQRRESEPFYCAAFERDCPAMSASVSTATARDTQRMLEALDEAPGGFLLSPDWAPSTQLDFALALADRPCGAKLRILLGAANEAGPHRRRPRGCWRDCGPGCGAGQARRTREHGRSHRALAGGWLAGRGRRRSGVGRVSPMDAVGGAARTSESGLTCDAAGSYRVAIWL